ncbi:MAG: hypothetical protein PUF50_03970 [Erysipelotrichaceae bacterium]|nr:hypothetical protein [Erysipelotrichaceae bacterium]
MDNLALFNEDLTSTDESYRDGDIMQVYRMCSFLDVDEEMPYWECDESWARPTEEQRKEHEEMVEKQRQERLEEMLKENEKAKMIRQKECISVIAQGFYGN